MSTERATPEELLRRIHAEEEAKEKEKKGKLCIFLGYAAGVGKTCAMLDAAHELLKEGVDLVSGYIEPHARPETSKREEGLEKAPLSCHIRELISGSWILTLFCEENHS